ncbi:hypothetical protein SAMN04490182_1404 [Pseudomonas cedrina]|uniref:protein adenylyltransferase n=2 Tax=Pseudomonas cedrina TaxID=651740 RepID=A0A1V2JYT3_PSECE|nr:hypothetical protein [Pseudomonas cedrina]ONH50662.1 hypothetical protein BLL36_24790 [Pseudomonas cedrina subsp. cedrina]SDS38017.1 hypothetical protein SAMN04490182_1404 [Pseudomonas cedrina]
MSFDPFGDFETAGYLQNALQLKDPVEVKESEHLSFELSMEDALVYLAKKKPIDYACVLKVHEILFSDFYPWAGKARTELVPHLAVFKGSQDDEWPAMIGGIKGLDGLDKEGITYESLDNPEIQQIYNSYRTRVFGATRPAK